MSGSGHQNKQKKKALKKTKVLPQYGLTAKLASQGKR